MPNTNLEIKRKLAREGIKVVVKIECPKCGLISITNTTKCIRCGSE